MRRLPVLALLLLLPAAAQGQPQEVYLTSQRPPVRIMVMSLYQRYVEGGRPVAELSLPVSAFVPVGTRLGLRLQASPASATGRDLEPLSGMSDAQLALSLYQRFGRSSLVAGVSVNLPSGRRELTEDEFRTSVHLSQDVYDFYLPVFGQGFNVAPSVTWAVPLGDRWAFGGGVSYQYRGAFRPLEGAGRYDPGDEVLILGGLDYRLSPNWALSGDFSYTLYGTDRVDGVNQYAAGARTIATLQLLGYRGYNELRLLARYRSRARSTLPAAGTLVTEAERTVPDQAQVLCTYRLRGSERAYLTLRAQGRFFTETVAFPRRVLFGVGALPEYALSDLLWLLMRFRLTLGDLSGFEAGLGMAAVF